MSNKIFNPFDSHEAVTDERAKKTIMPVIFSDVITGATEQEREKAYNKAMSTLAFTLTAALRGGGIEGFTALWANVKHPVHNPKGHNGGIFLQLDSTEDLRFTPKAQPREEAPAKEQSTEDAELVAAKKAAPSIITED